METLQPKLRFPNYINNYKNIIFNEVVESYGYGPRFNANDYSEIGNVKTIRGTDISLDGEIKYFQVPTALLDDNTVNTHKLLDGDLVMITTADCGLTGVFRKQDIDFIPSAYAVRIRLNENANSFYFKYFFQTKLAKNQVDKFIRKATVANLPGSDILKFNINLPTIEEQNIIGNFLSSVDEKLNLLKEKKALLEDYKKGIMQKIFNHEIRFKDDNGNDFNDWQYSVLSSVFNISTGKSKSNFIEKDGKYIIVDMGGISSNCKLIAKKYTSYNKDILNIGDLIMPKDDIGVGLIIGKTVVINENDKYILGDHVYKLVLKDNTFNPNFFSYYINSDKINIELRRKTNGTAQISLNKDAVYEQSIIIPEIKEQTKIANFLSAIDEKIELVSNQIQNTQEYKKGLLQQMFV
jgi:type I restriction enzyme S subunit